MNEGWQALLGLLVFLGGCVLILGLGKILLDEDGAPAPAPVPSVEAPAPENWDCEWAPPREWETPEPETPAKVCW